MPNVNLTLPTLPTSDQKDAMDNANTPDASNPFLTNNDLPATPDLNTVLTAGSTSNTPINSTNGRSTVSFAGTSTFISYVQATVTSIFTASNLSALFSWTNGTKTGSVTANVTKTEVVHTDLINLSATSVTKNGSEIAITSEVPFIEIMTGSLTVFSPSDSTTTYVGPSTPLAPSATDTVRQFKGVSGTVKGALLYVDPTATIGSSEAVTYNLWNVTDTTLVGTIGTITYDQRGSQVMYTGLSLAMLNTKNYAVQIVNPAFATNPSNCYTTCKLVVYP